MGVSRDTFYRYQELAAEGGIDALVNQNRLDEATERAVVEYAAVGSVLFVASTVSRAISLFLPKLFGVM